MTVKGTWTARRGYVITDTPLGGEFGSEHYVVCDGLRTLQVGHLIAAAPDMYRALEKALDMFRVSHGYRTPVDDPVWEMTVRNTEGYSAIRAALAKARGESE